MAGGLFSLLPISSLLRPLPSPPPPSSPRTPFFSFWYALERDSSHSFFLDSPNPATPIIAVAGASCMYSTSLIARFLPHRIGGREKDSRREAKAPRTWGKPKAHNDRAMSRCPPARCQRPPLPPSLPQPPHRPGSRPRPTRARSQLAPASARHWQDTFSILYGSHRTISVCEPVHFPVAPSRRS